MGQVNMDIVKLLTGTSSEKLKVGKSKTANKQFSLDNLLNQKDGSKTDTLAALMALLENMNVQLNNTANNQNVQPTDNVNQSQDATNMKNGVYTSGDLLSLLLSLLQQLNFKDSTSGALKNTGSPNGDIAQAGRNLDFSSIQFLQKLKLDPNLKQLQSNPQLQQLTDSQLIFDLPQTMKTTEASGVNPEGEKQSSSNFGQDILSLIDQISAKLQSNEAQLNSTNGSEVQNIIALLKTLTNEAGGGLPGQNSATDTSSNNRLVSAENFFIKPKILVQGTQNNSSDSTNVYSKETDILRKISEQGSINYKDLESLKKTASQTDSTLKDTVADKKTSLQNNVDSNSAFANVIPKSIDSKNIDVVSSGEKVVINRNNFSNDVVKSIKFMETNDLKDLTVKVMPKELGEVVIKLTMDGNVMKASITAANKDTYNLINSNLQDINNKISQSNMSIQSFSVNVFNGDTTFMRQQNGQENGQNQGKKKNSSFSSEEEDTAIEAANLDLNNNVNVLA